MTSNSCCPCKPTFTTVHLHADHRMIPHYYTTIKFTPSFPSFLNSILNLIRDSSGLRRTPRLASLSSSSYSTLKLPEACTTKPIYALHPFSLVHSTFNDRPSAESSPSVVMPLCLSTYKNCIIMYEKSICMLQILRFWCDCSICMN